MRIKNFVYSCPVGFVFGKSIKSKSFFEDQEYSFIFTMLFTDRGLHRCRVFHHNYFSVNSNICFVSRVFFNHW